VAFSQKPDNGVLFSQKSMMTSALLSKSMTAGSLAENTMTLSEITSSLSKSLIAMRENRGNYCYLFQIFTIL